MDYVVRWYPLGEFSLVTLIVLTLWVPSCLRVDVFVVDSFLSFFFSFFFLYINVLIFKFFIYGFAFSFFRRNPNPHSPPGCVSAQTRDCTRIPAPILPTLTPWVWAKCAN